MIDINEMGLLIPSGKIRVHTGNVVKSVRVDILLIAN